MTVAGGSNAPGARTSAASGRRRRSGSRGRRGVSEVVGFVLVFAVVFAGVGAVYAGGFDALSAVEDRQQVASAERAFLVLSESVDDVRSGTVGRTWVVSPGTGRLQVDPGPAVTIRGNGSTRRIETSALTYRADGTRITHEAGGVFRVDGGDSVVRHEPAVACRPGAGVSIISVATLRADRAAIDADGPVEVTLRPTSTTSWRADRATVNVTTSAAREAWSRHLERSGWNETDAGTYGCDADRTVIRRTTVRVRFVT